jgi:WD40 repeat protein
MQVSADNRWMVTVGSKELGNFPGLTKHVRLWDLSEKQPMAIRLGGHVGGVRFAEFTADSRWLISTGATMKTVQVWDLDRKNPADKPMLLGGHNDDVSDWQLSPDKQWLATRSKDRTIRLWKLSQGAPPTPAFVIEAENDQDEFDSFEFSPNSRWLAATRPEAKSVSLWDLASADPSANQRLYRADSPVMSNSTFSSDSLWLLNWKYGQERLHLTDLASENTIEPEGIELRGRYDRVGLTSAMFSPDGHWLATFCDGQQTRLWDLSARNPAVAPIVLTGALWEHSSGVDSRHDYGVRNAPFTGDGRWFVTRYQTANGLPNTALWHLRIEELVELARRIAGRSLSSEERQLYLIPGD